MPNRWLAIGRPLWVFFACNSVLVFAITMGVMLQILQEPSARLTEGLAALDLTLGFYAGFYLVTSTLFFLTFFIVALLIFLRRPADGFALFVALFFVNFGAASVFPSFVEYLKFQFNPPLWYIIPTLISTLFSWTFLVAFLVLYPDGHFVPHWTWILAVIGFLTTAVWGTFPGWFAEPSSPLGLGGAAVAILLTALAAYAQYWRYRHYSSALQRQQTKWFVFALCIVLLATATTFLLPLFLGTGQTPAQTILSDFVLGITGNFSFIIVPIAVGFAILRYRLWDIDILIRKTLTYAIVGAILALVYYVSVVVLQQLLASLTGDRSQIITVLSTLAIAALFVPVRNRIQSAVDRRFYRQKYDARQILNQYGATVRDETDLEVLGAQLIGVVNETVKPTRTTLWLKRQKQAHE